MSYVAATMRPAMGVVFSWSGSVLVLLLLSLAMDAPSLAGAAPVDVKLRIEGETRTIYEGNILTRAHMVTTASGGTHQCDGTNNGANPSPGATATTALDDASLGHKRFRWDGTFSTEFDDFFVTSIGDSSQTSTQFWGLLVNYQFSPVGGCQEQVHKGEEVLWAYDAFNKSHFLKLSGPKVVTRMPFTLTVTDGSTGLPVSGAVVHPFNRITGHPVNGAAGGGMTTNAKGQVVITGKLPGLHAFKAVKPDAIRSNVIEVLVA